jgi:hypothetical protein
MAAFFLLPIGIEDDCNDPKNLDDQTYQNLVLRRASCVRETGNKLCSTGMRGPTAHVVLTS